MANPNIVAVVSGILFSGAQIQVNTFWTSDIPVITTDAPPVDLGQSGASVFFIDVPSSTADYNARVSAGQAAWFLLRGVVTGQITVGLQYPALDPQGKTLTKSAGTDTPGVYGRYTAPGFSFTVLAGQMVIRAIEWPFPISIIQGTLYLDGTQSGDEVGFSGPPVDLKAAVGGLPVLSAPIGVGDKEMTFIVPFLQAFVNQAVLDSGYWEVEVSDSGGGNPEPTKPLVRGYDNTFASGDVPLGIVKEYDWGGAAPDDWEFQFAHGVDAKIVIQRWFIPYRRLDGGAGALPFGDSARGGAPIPQLVPMLIYYKNNGLTDKTIVCGLDIGTGVQV